jgi:uncharacterized protein (TIGR00730 family)
LRDDVAAPLRRVSALDLHAFEGLALTMTKYHSKIRAICVYCGSQPGRDTTFRQAGRALGRSMAENNIRLIYGGGTRGVMGAVADGVMSAGGKVTGIIPEFLMDKEATRHDLGQLNELIVTRDMHERKHAMFERADAFVTLPGGIGTLEEIIEIMTWAQLGRHEKPMVLANIGGFWDPLMALIDHMASQGFIHTAHRVKPLVIEDVETIVPNVIAAATEAANADGEAEIIERL